MTQKNQYLISELEEFIEEVISLNKGRSVFLVRFTKISGIQIEDFTKSIYEHLSSSSFPEELYKLKFHYIHFDKAVLLGIAPKPSCKELLRPEFVIKDFQNQIAENKENFYFGTARTQVNFISEPEEIFHLLHSLAIKNLEDNALQKRWLRLNRLNAYIADSEIDSLIQPTICYEAKKDVFHTIGGEVFIGNSYYKDYAKFLEDIPQEEDQDRIQLLLVEKQILSCRACPGLLKFNIHPQNFINFFSTRRKVEKLIQLIQDCDLEPKRIRIELLEQPYEYKEKEHKMNLRELCSLFHEFGITFAADDFGVKSQSHQIVLELGKLIQEFKLDPMSFEFKEEEEPVKFLDNLAFLEYCSRLSHHRNAVITAEAVKDYEILSFLMEKKVYQYQSYILSKKIPIALYKENFSNMQSLPSKTVFTILQNPDLLNQNLLHGNIFLFAQQKNLAPSPPPLQ